MVLALQWSVKQFFAPNFPIFRITLAKSREEREREEGKEEHRQIAKRCAFHANAKSKGFSQPVFTCSKPTKETLEKK